MRLGGDGNLLGPFPTRPRRMRKSTYEQLRRAAETAEGSAYESLRAMLRSI
jgi:hypothetical protein